MCLHIGLDRLNQRLDLDLLRLCLFAFCHGKTENTIIEMRLYILI